MISRKILALVLLSMMIVSMFIAPLRVNAQEDDEVEVSEDAEPTPQSGGAGEDGEYDEEVDVETEAEDVVKPLVASPHAETSVIFPDFQDEMFTQGEEIVLLLGFHNSGDKTFNITHIGAHLHSPFDFTYYIQNFTVREIGAEVSPGEEISVEYRFKPDATLEPLEFWLSAWALYNDTDSEQFQSTFFNTTVEIVERKSQINVKAIFHYLFLIGLGGLIVYAIYHAVAPKKRRSAHKEGSSRETVATDWSTNIYTPAAHSKAFGSRKNKAAKTSSKKR